MFTRRESGRIVDGVDRLSDGPSGDMAHGWVYGVAAALVPLSVGVYGIVARRGWMLASRGRGLVFIRVEGTAAAWLGAMLVSFALALHFHWFWGNHHRLGRYHQPAKLFAITALFASTVGFIYFYIPLLGVFR